MKRALVIGLLSTHLLTHAQGVPVYDAASVFQAIRQMQAWETQYQQMYRQLLNQKAQIESMTGSRGLGTIANEITKPLIVEAIQQQVTDAQTRKDLQSLTSGQLNQLLKASEMRASQIQKLMSRVNATTDAKGGQEINARIAAEQVMVANEAKETQLLQQVAELKKQQMDEERRLESLKRLTSSGILRSFKPASLQ